MSTNRLRSDPHRAATLAAVRLALAIALVIPIAIALLAVAPPAAIAGSCAEDPGNLLKNGTMLGAPPDANGDVVASYWTKFVNSGNQVHFENPQNEGWDSNGSQYIWSDFGPYKAGIYQRVTNLTPGQTYHFWIVWGQTLQDIYGVQYRTTGIDRHLGVDLSGGTNPSASSVQWTVPYTGESGFNVPQWNFYFTATGSSATFFLRAINSLTSGRDKVFFDTACLYPAPGNPTSTPWSTPGGGTITPTFTPTNTPTTIPGACTVQPLATVAVGPGPKGIAVDPSTNRVFVGLYESSSVAVLNGSTNQLLATWATGSGGHTNGVAFAQGKLFVSNHDTNNVSVLNGSTGAPLATIPVGHAPYFMAASTDRVWVANFDDSTVSTINATNNTVIKTVAVGSQPGQIAVLGNHAYVPSWGYGLSEVDETGSVARSLPLDAGTFGAAANAAASRLYTSNRATLVLSAIDAVSGAVIATAPEGSPPFALAADAGVSRLFAVMGNLNRLHAYDLATQATVADVALGPQGPQGGDSIGILGDTLYIANNYDGTVSVIAACYNGKPSTQTPTPTATATATRTSTSTPTSTPSFTPGAPTGTPTFDPNAPLRHIYLPEVEQ